MALDVLTLLKQDHQAAEALLRQFDQTALADREEYFCEVVHTLVAHEVAEELVVYPVLRDGSREGEEVVYARIGEQAEAEATLAELEDIDRQSDEFTTTFLRLRDAVLAHAQGEEATVFPLLVTATTVEKRQELGDRYQKAQEIAPTHPHPHAPDMPPGNTIIGPITAIFDRFRDVLHRV
jgi:hemerythrin superfamily protein